MLKHNDPNGRRGAFFHNVGVGLAMLMLTGCVHSPKGKSSQDIYKKPEPLTVQKSSMGEQMGRPAATVQQQSPSYGQTRHANGVAQQLPSDVGSVPVISEKDGVTDAINNRAPKPKVRTVDAYVDPLPVPQFIDVVFGKVLEVPYVTGPDVAKMTDLVQLRSSGKIESADFLALTSTALENYGVRVLPKDGSYHLIIDKSFRAQRPQFIKSRARLNTRSDLRPVIQFVELNALDANSIIPLLQQAFGQNKDKLAIGSNPQKNYITLSGLPSEVDAVVAVIRELDELNYAGTQVRKYSPKYWNSADFSKELMKALKVEGWSVTDNPILTRTIFLMPVEYSNTVFIFSKSDTASERINKWIFDLDQPVKGGDTEQIFIYQVKNVEAQTLADTANQVLYSSSSNQSSVRPISSGPQRQDSFGGASLGGQGGLFTVDEIGNRIIFTGTASDYDKFIGLLEQLDTLAPEVLIEVKIAEVTLTDDTNYGIEFFIDDLGDENVQATFGSQGLGIGSSGLNIGLLSGNVDASINAFATNRRVKLLSTPSLTARSGSEAELQVGQEVPILTSQRAANNQTGSGPIDIIQEVAYRDTGIILSLSPTVFSDNRIDLTISQEVSSTVDSANSVIASPTISNRSFSTQLSLQDGQTAVLGGLIQENRVLDEKGVPILKDIPLIGSAFSSKGLNSTRTELVVLITAYVLRGQQDKKYWVDQYRNRIDGFLLDESDQVTLLPRKF